MIARIALLIVICMLASCAPVKSKRFVNSSDSGLVYRLPKRGIDIDVTFDESDPPVVKISEGASFGDSSEIYVASIPRNTLGRVNTTVTVTPNGLLTTTTAAYTNQVADLLAAWRGESATHLDAVNLGPPEEEDDDPYIHCPKKGAVHYTVYLAKQVGKDDKRNGWSGGIEPDEEARSQDITQGCPISIKIRRAWQPVADKLPTCTSPSKAEESDTCCDNKDSPSSSGYYYRINMPYAVTVKVVDLTTEYLALLPDESTRYFVRLPRALLADTSNTTTFTDGVLTTHTQWTDSETIALLKLPAELIRTYAAAAGSFFDSFKARDISRAQYDAQVAANVYQRVQIAVCLNAIKNNPNDPKLTDLCSITVPTH